MHTVDTYCETRYAVDGNPTYDPTTKSLPPIISRKNLRVRVRVRVRVG